MDRAHLGSLHDRPSREPAPFSDAAADHLFDRLRADLGLPARRILPEDLDPAAWRVKAERAGAEPVDW